jgi:polyhydroxyalkanoate synthesis regulator phasin
VSAAMPQAKKGPEEVEGATRNVLNPLDVMVITRERLQDTLDDAVRRGRMTRDDATDLLAEIVRRAVSAPTDRVKREVRRVTGAVDGFPIDDYDELTAAQIVSQLAGLEAGDLRRVRDYERRNANRKTVLSAVDTKLS